jgi:glycosyltransferase involved in cell wall biosynthesis
MSSPQVTVVLPVYNGGATLAVALRSVLAQTFEDYELLVLDDGSTDNSLQVARSFSDCRLHVLSDGMRHGLAARLNQGAGFARGRYIARMDQDDICFPERLARQFDFLENHSEIDLLGCRAVVFLNAREIVGLVPFRRTHEEICTDPWRGLYLVHPSWMGRTDWFRRHRYRMPEKVLAEDQELLLRAYPESRFACLDEVLLAYRTGRFRLSKTLRGRRALLGIQLFHFVRRRQWSNVARSVALTFLKVVIDCAVFLPGRKRPSFLRTTEPAPTSVMIRLQDLMRSSECEEPSAEEAVR